MTREERLYSMRMIELVAEAEKFGIKIDKKGSKEKAVNKILAFEAEAEKARLEAEETKRVITEETIKEELKEFIHSVETEQEPAAEEPKKRNRKHKELSNDVSGLLDFIITKWQELGGIIKTPGKENAVFRPLCMENGRQVIKLMWTAEKISLFVRVEPATDFAEKWQKINYSMPYQCMFFNNTETVHNNIMNLMEMVKEADSIRSKKRK